MPLAGLLFLQQVQELLVGQDGLANDALDNVFGQVESFMVRNCDSTGLVWMFELDVRTGLLMNMESGPFQSTHNFARLQAA